MCESAPGTGEAWGQGITESQALQLSPTNSFSNCLTCQGAAGVLAEQRTRPGTHSWLGTVLEEEQIPGLLVQCSNVILRIH